MEKKKPDAFVQTRCSRTTIATLAKYFLSEGEHPRSQYELIRRALEEYERILVENNLVEQVAFTADAQTILDTLSFDFSGGGRTDKAFYHNLSRESLRIEKMQVPPERTKEAVTEDLMEAMKHVPKEAIKEDEE